MRRAALALLLAACASSPAKPPEIERTERAIDLSGEWNDVDADLVAQEIIRECFKDPWADQWAKAHGGKRPRIRLYPIKNKTAAYVDYRFFTKQIEKALVTSGKVEVLAEAPSTASADDEEEAAPLKGPAADFVLNGYLLSQDDQAGNQEVRAYLTSIEVVEADSGKKAWVGQKRIRKLITR